MPAHNARGPMGLGPMTGRRRGDCVSPAETKTETTNANLPPQGCGMGLGRFNRGHRQGGRRVNRP